MIMMQRLLEGLNATFSRDSLPTMHQATQGVRPDDSDVMQPHQLRLAAFVLRKLLLLHLLLHGRLSLWKLVTFKACKQCEHRAPGDKPAPFLER